MFCQSCGGKIKEGARFCAGCGSAVAGGMVPSSQQEPINQQVSYEQASSVNQPVVKDNKVFAIICFSLSLFSFIVFLFINILVGFILSLVADVFGYIGIKSSLKYLSIIGIIISLIIFIWYLVI